MTTAGAASVTPSDNARPIRNRKLASDRVAHVEPPLEILVRRVDLARVEERHDGHDRMTIASGRPK